MLAFALMSIIPLLACMYVISLYAFPHQENLINISGVVLMSLVVALLGLLLAKGLVDPVIDMAIEAKIIANGEFGRRLPVSGDDEVGNLAESINTMTQRIKSNLDELKSYGQKMREINIDVHKKVLALSSLLQIGDIISAGAIQLDSVLELAVEKSAMIFDNGFSVLYMAKDETGDFTERLAYGIEEEGLKELAIKRSGQGVFEKVLAERSIFILDKSTKLTRELEEFRALYHVVNLLAIPIFSGKKNLGLFVIGNKLEDYKYKNDDMDLAKVFAKQITIAIESDMLDKKTKELAIKDELTDLYNKNFIVSRLEEEIKRAIFYQRPCSFIVLNVDDFDKFRKTHGELDAEEVLRRIAKLLKDNTVPIGKLGRIGGDEFAMILPEKNKKEACGIAEDIRKKIEGTPLLKNKNVTLTVSVGVSENPIDGVTSDELLKKAMEAIRNAKSSGKNKVVA